MTKSFISVFTFILIIVSLNSCQNESAGKPPALFAPLDVYFQKEIKQLKNSNLKLTKKLLYKDHVEELVVEEPEWDNELVPFTETISSQQAKIQAFSIDTIRHGDKLHLNYSARDTASVIRLLSVYSTSDIHDSIIIIRKVSNPYYQSTDTLKYYGKGNYFISAENLPGIGKKMGFVLQGFTSQGAAAK